MWRRAGDHFDGNGNTWGSTAVAAGDNRYPGLLTIMGGNAMTVGGVGYQIDATPNGCMTWGYALSGSSVQAPTITSFTPSSGPIGTTVTITGTNFTPTSAVAFNNTPAAATVLNSTTISTVVAPGTTTGPISVTTLGGTAVSAANFTIIQAPVITSFTPTIGGTGTVVTITGVNFTGTTTVTFGGNAAQAFTVVDDSTITATVGSGASGTISVTNPGGTAVSSAIFTFAQQITNYSSWRKIFCRLSAH